MGNCCKPQEEYEFIAKIRAVYEELFDTLYSINNGRFAKRTKNPKKNPKLMATARATMLAAADNIDDPTFKTVNNALEHPWDKKAKQQMIPKKAFVDGCVIAMLALYNRTFNDFGEIMTAITKRETISDTLKDPKTRIIKNFDGVKEQSLIITFQNMWKVFDDANWAITTGACCGLGGESYLSKGSLNVWVEYGQRHDIKLFLDFVTAFDEACPDLGFPEEDFVNFAGEWASEKIINAAKIMRQAIVTRIRLTSSSCAVDKYVKGVSQDEQLESDKSEAFKLTDVHGDVLPATSPHETSTAGEAPEVSRMPSPTAPPAIGKMSTDFSGRRSPDAHGHHYYTQTNAQQNEGIVE